MAPIYIEKLRYFLIAAAITVPKTTAPKPIATTCSFAFMPFAPPAKIFAAEKIAQLALGIREAKRRENRVHNPGNC